MLAVEKYWRCVGGCFVGNHAHQGPEIEALVGADTEHAQALDREHRPALAFAPVEAAHPGEILRARQARLAALELVPGSRRAQQVANAPGKQSPLRRLDEEVGGAGFVGARDRGVVVEAGQHQHRQRFEAAQHAQFTAGLEAVEAGHHGVENDDVGKKIDQRRDRLLAAGGLGDAEALVLQCDRGEQQVDLVVVDEQHLRSFREVFGQGLAAHHGNARPAARRELPAPSGGSERSERGGVIMVVSPAWDARLVARPLVRGPRRRAALPDLPAPPVSLRPRFRHKVSTGAERRCLPTTI